MTTHFLCVLHYSLLSFNFIFLPQFKTSYHGIRTQKDKINKGNLKIKLKKNKREWERGGTILNNASKHKGLNRHDQGLNWKRKLGEIIELNENQTIGDHLENKERNEQNDAVWRHYSFSSSLSPWRKLARDPFAEPLNALPRLR